MLKKKDWGKIEPFLLRGQQLFNLLEERKFYIRKRFYSHRIGLGYH